MFNVAIIGAGQLGSRHLQGLKNAASPLSITVVDNNECSLKVAKERYDAIAAIGEKNVVFTTEISQLPTELDLVVVATSSKPRAIIVKALLEHSDVKNLILEKVLFTRLKEYDEIQSLLYEKNVKCWVNCPRRMFGSYQTILSYLSRQERIVMEYNGCDWGLCCNAMHFIDAFMYLTGEESYKIDSSGIESEIIESKRNGYIEMNGTLSITTPQGHSLLLSSFYDISDGACVVIKNGDHNIILDEVHGNLTIDGKDLIVKTPYQSQMTGLLADMLFSTGFCPLTQYEVSAGYHRTFIKELLSVYNRITNIESDMLPIT